MPKGHPKSLDKLDELISLVKAQESRLSSLESKLVKGEKEPEEIKVERSGERSIENYVPIEFKQLVEERLNRAFGVQVNPFPDRPEFEFIVNIPKKYSNASPAHWETYKCDMRYKIIENARGPHGVREYVDLIRENLGPDIRTLIDTDKSQNLDLAK